MFSTILNNISSTKHEQTYCVLKSTEKALKSHSLHEEYSSRGIIKAAL